MVHDPILALSSMLLAVKFAKLGDAQLDEWLTHLDGRVRAARAGGPEWAAIYRDALSLVPRILHAQGELQRRAQAEQQSAAARRMIQAAAMSLPSALQRVGAEYQGRLQTQELELLEKAERAIAGLPVASVRNKATGETVFTVPDDELAAFWGWVQGADDKWRSHNTELAATRANEAIAMMVADLPPTARFDVQEPQIPRRQAPPPALKGHSVPTPGVLDSVGRTWKGATAAAGSVSAALIVVGRVMQDKVAVLAIVGVAVFVIALVFAVATVPGQVRQQRKRTELRAQEAVHRELRDAVKARLREASDAQLRAIRGHLANEGERWRAFVRRSDGGESVRSLPPQGLTPDNQAKLGGEWQQALRARLAQLEGH
jgi:type II secretory pathway pseudopilin PulG